MGMGMGEGEREGKGGKFASVTEDCYRREGLTTILRANISSQATWLLPLFSGVVSFDVCGSWNLCFSAFVFTHLGFQTVLWKFIQGN